MSDKNKKEEPSKLLVTEDQIKALYPKDSDNIKALEEKKARAELILLADQNSQKSFPPKASKNLWNWLDRNTKRLVAIGSFVTAFIFLINPLYNYLDHAGKREQAHFNGEMISLIKDISDTNKVLLQQPSLNILSSYDPKLVIPFLLDDLNKEPDDSKREKKISTEQIRETIVKSWATIDEPGWIIKTYNNITGKKTIKEEITSVIYSNAKKAFQKIDLYNDMDLETRSLIDNYLFLIRDLCLNNGKNEIKKQLDSIKIVNTNSLLANREDSSARQFLNALIDDTKCK